MRFYEPSPFYKPAPFELELEDWHCLRCDRGFPCNFGDVSETIAPNAIGHRIHPTGAFLSAQGGSYCASCAPNVRFCKVCGCTDEAGCRGGCSWESQDLCSVCA